MRAWDEKARNERNEGGLGLIADGGVYPEAQGIGNR